MPHREARENRQDFTHRQIPAVEIRSIVTPR
jgi:hypothetical protein